MNKITITFELDSNEEAQVYLNAMHHYSELWEHYNLVRACIKHNGKAEETLENLYNRLSQHLDP